MEGDNCVDDRGQTAIEYVLVALLVALVIVLAFKRVALDEAVSTAADNIQKSMVVTE